MKTPFETRQTRRAEAPPPVYILELRAVPGNHRADPVQRLRALLKAALRGYGFRCLSARPAPPATEAKGQGGHRYE